MPTKAHSSVPNSFVASVQEAERFAGGIQRIYASDDRDIGVATAAVQFTELMQGVVEYLDMPSEKGAATIPLSELGDRIDPAVAGISQMITVFRQDAASGNAALPDMNDLEIGLSLIVLEPEALFRLLELITLYDLHKPSPERTELVECLSEVGVPVATFGLQLPVLIKIFFAVLAAILFVFVPGAQNLALKILNALAKMDRRGQDDGDGDGDGDDNDPPKKTPCGNIVPIDEEGSGKTKGKALNQAFRKALIRAGMACEDGCIPILQPLPVPFKCVGGENGEPFTVGFTFRFRCTKLS